MFLSQTFVGVIGEVQINSGIIENRKLIHIQYYYERQRGYGSQLRERRS